ncbi:MAG TPA: recombinase family protein [Chthoniobacteraceae bacterium]|nr:recombinase family protein [Chthoniobacteraceae bacterium]
MRETEIATPTIKAAAYVRMSTEHQKYSTSNQMDVIQEYASQRGMEIVRIYSDEGKSGLSIKGRKALARMFSDVESGQNDFGSILVYDISRWGRFQDSDEGAHYEFICRQHGIAVHYCAEQFENDGSMMANMNKMMKRVMAGTYSLELSAKVFQGACRLIQMGYKQGGTAGFGLRRMLIDQSGQRKGLLKIGEHKSIQTDRVVLVPGPEDEIIEVRWIYDAFIRESLSESEIALALNCRGIRTDFNRPWSRATVHQILTNEKYIGNNVYHRTSFKLKAKHVKNSPEHWIRADEAWPPVIDKEIFRRAQEIILERSRKLSDKEMLEKLQNLFRKHGRISGILIDENEEMPSSAAFRYRFGSLIKAYFLIGYSPPVDYTFIEDNRAIRRMRPELFREIIFHLEQMGAGIELDRETDLLLINHEIWVSIVLCRHFTTGRGSSRWLVRLDSALNPDLTIAARLCSGNKTIQDYYLLPALDITPFATSRRLADENQIELDAYRVDDLSFFFRMAERVDIKNLL